MLTAQARPDVSVTLQGEALLAELHAELVAAVGPPAAQ